MGRKAGVPTGRCTVCAHLDRGRIDYLAAMGNPLSPLAAQFGLSADAMERHCRNHIAEDFKRRIRTGPLQSEETLRKLAAEEGVSVLQHLQGLRGLLTSRLMVAYAAGADGTIATMVRELRQTAELMAKLSKELLPATSEMNFYSVQINAVDNFERDMLEFARSNPGAVPYFVAFFKSRVSQPRLVDVSPELRHVG
jgi:hypothetical protein